ncbi:MAG: HutP family protein [Clostridiales bacterium 38_11]|nr:MAG: HutP family protein [Clostridiales bacterium 38_11]HBH13031.1 HutP family protein [Clostridiales bacterium]
MNKEFIKETITKDGKVDIGKAAVFISMIESKNRELFVKTYIEELGLRVVITEVAGSGGDLKKKIINSCVGAALNIDVIDKEAHHVHGLIHAAQEAGRGLMLDMPLDANLHIKIAIVRSEHWIAVSMYGNSAYHILSNHSRLGLGYVNI